MGIVQDAAEKYLELKKWAEEPTLGDFATRASREGKRRRSQEALPAAKEEYLRVLGESLSGLLVTGPAAEDFCKLAGEQTVVIDGDLPYRQLADSVWTGVPRTPGPHAWTVTYYSKVLDGLTSMLQEMGGPNATPPVFKPGTVLVNYEAFVQYIKSLVETSPGIGFVARYLTFKIGQACLAQKVDAESSRIVVTGLAAKSPLTRRVFSTVKSVRASGTVTPEDVATAVTITEV